MKFHLYHSNKIQKWEDKYVNCMDVNAVINSLRPEILEMFRKTMSILKIVCFHGVFINLFNFVLLCP